MFDRFTKPCKAVMYHARPAAQSRGQDSIGPEHLLLGLLEVQSCAAESVLADLDVDRDELRRAVDTNLPAGDTDPKPRKLPFTEPAKRVLVHGMEAARELGHKTIGTGHLLLALHVDATLQDVFGNLEEEAVRERVLVRQPEEDSREPRRLFRSCAVLGAAVILVAVVVGKWLS